MKDSAFKSQIRLEFPGSKTLRNDVDELYSERTINDDGDVVYSIDLSKVPLGKVIVYSHSGPNDEPPYVGTTFYQVCPEEWYPVNPYFTKRAYYEDGESYTFFLVDANRHRAESWCSDRNAWEIERLDNIGQEDIERSYGE